MKMVTSGIVRLKALFSAVSGTTIWMACADRGRYRVAVSSDKIESIDLAKHASVLATVKDKARYRARACGPP
jgi:hypothetical protein